MTTKINQAIQWLRTHVGEDDTILCATSGGLDSMCLAHLLHQLGYGLTVAHYHHGLREQAHDDAAFVEAWCQERDVPFVMERGDVAAYAKAQGLGLEEAGRMLRYDFFRRSADDYDCTWIATAHHGDDNVETMLLNLCRGTGLAGLCGIPAISGQVIRPLLGVSRQDLEAYGQAEGVAHITDHTNADVAFARNRLRHQVLPVLQTINPQFVDNFARTAQILSQEQGYLTAQAQAIPCVEQEGSASFLWADLLECPALCHRAIHQAICHLAGQSRDITAQHVAAVAALQGQVGQVSLPYGLVAKSTAKALIVEKTAPLPASTPLSVDKPVQFGAWQVDLSTKPLSHASYLVHLSDTALIVTPWQRQDRMGTRSLKRCFVDCGIAHAQRDTLPTVRNGSSVIAVCQMGVHPDFVTSGEETSLFYITFTYKGE